MSVQAFKNVILRRLSREVIDRLELQRVELPVNREIEFPGSGIANLVFIEEGRMGLRWRLRWRGRNRFLGLRR
jgi:hypothetical protein